ncbi:hypothetical protein [Sulfitobacter aestuariivivens]|uniref:Uncharacterized protein n=1 Tax=Sulfitobacter aestuariivivens TaxID=2766981 RepID=A0A927D074_9RHOB|nr:hypothetical protein [Sulfitobacter aestuariivivens]MBD3662614.1 hypothetical protein [Sulfitobacter aestuariivivens]
MKSLLGVALCAVAAVAVAVFLVQREIIDVTTDPPRSLEPRSTLVGDDATPDTVRRALLEAGLNDTPVLGDTGVTAHLARLERGQVSSASLLEYAEDLNTLSRLSAVQGRSIPSAFWDVETPALIKDGWTPHAIVAHLADDRGRPYVDVLSRAYGRFYEYRAGANPDDTALNAAFDILDVSHSYILSLPEDRRLQHGPKLRSVEAATLMSWQTLVAGTTRRIPGLGRPIFDHGFVGRFSVKTIYQYDVKTPMSVGEVWGTSGFKERFVGPAENNNQVEHLTISALLQAVAGTPAAVLNAVELEKAASAQASPGEARADMRLNNAIRQFFVPTVFDDLGIASRNLKAALQD